jgi:uncharacterized Rossmann fold enzyme
LNHPIDEHGKCGRNMQPVDARLVQVQNEIREAFGWSLESDIDSAQLLRQECTNPSTTIRIKGTVTVVGAAAPYGVTSPHPIIAADGAVGAISDLSQVILIVSDGDGSPHLERSLNRGIPLCLHAHGDNIPSWRNVLSNIDSHQEIILTHQTPNSIDGMHNPGGFTDGDRAVCIAFALGADAVELVGFSTDDVGKWSGVTDVARKLTKLTWMKHILGILSLEVES